MFKQTTKMQVKTLVDYRRLKEQKLKEVKALGDKLSQKEMNVRAMAVASSLEYSLTSVMNYLKGVGTNPETAFEILEKYKELYK